MDDLAATSPRVVAAIVELVYDELARDPRRVGKPLRFDLEGFYSARRAEYRVIYRIEDAAEVVRIAARRPEARDLSTHVTRIRGRRDQLRRVSRRVACPRFVFPRLPIWKARNT